MKQKSAQNLGQNAKRSAYAPSHGIESESMASLTLPPSLVHGE